MNVYGQLLRAQLEVRTSDHVGTIPGMVWFHNTEKRIKFSEGTLVVSLLANDQNAVFGTNGTAANNIRFNRSGDETLQLVLGSDATAEGTVSANAAQIDARAANYSDAARPAFGNKGRLIYNTDDDQIQVDDGTQWTGVGGGGGGEIPNVQLGEDIPAGRAVFLWIKPVLTVDATNDWVDVNTGAGEVSFQIPQKNYLYDTDANRAEFHAVLKTAFEASAATGTLTPTFNTTTRLITLATSASTTWLWNTGTHGQTGTDLHIGTLLGFSDATDSASGTSVTATIEIDTTLSYLEFMYQTDADYTHKSKGYRGFLLTAGSKYDLRALKFSVEGTVFPTAGKSIGDELYTAKAGIEIVTGTNDDIDFNDGGDKVATLDAGYYPHPYEGLVADVKAKLDGTASSIVFSCSYDNDTDKFTIGGDSAFVLEGATGPNVATSAGPSLGFAVADTASLTSHVADNAIAKKGQLFRGTDPLVNSNSAYGGFARSPVSTVHAERDPGGAYIPVVNDAGGWLAAPVAETFSGHTGIGDQATHPSGYAYRVIIEDMEVTPDVYRVQYRPSANASWVTAAFSATPATAVFTNGLFATNAAELPLRPSVAVDPANALKAVLAYIWISGATLRIYAYHTTDGGVTWTKSTGTAIDGSLLSTSSNNRNIRIAIRESKCVVAVANSVDAVCSLCISDDSGSGYTSFGSVVSNSGNNPWGSSNMNLYIQYFQSETGVDKYRIVLVGTRFADSAIHIHWWKGDGTATGSAVGSTSPDNYMLGSAIDQIGTGNRIVFAQSGIAATAGISVGYTGETYNAGTLSVTAAGSDISSGKFTDLDADNGQNSDIINQSTYNEGSRLVLVGARGYLLASTGSVQNDTTKDVRLYITSSVTGGSWAEASAVISAGAAANNISASIAYISAKNALAMAWKSTSVKANDGTEGQIWARIGQIEGNTVSLGAAQQIDGGEAVAGFQGFSKVMASADTATVSWTKNQPITALRWNKFA